MDDFVSKLPRYRVTRSQDFPGFLIVYCGRKDCPGTMGDRPFLVAEKEWLRPVRKINARSGMTTVIVGRVCPYCYKAGRLPARAEIASTPE
jgi:hypothetical protein